MSMDEADRKEFIGAASGVLEDHDVGKVLNTGSKESVADFMNDLQIEDLQAVMQFLIEEEVITFDQ